jgi:uncharacterized protein
MKARWWWLFGLVFMLSAYAEVAVPELKQRVTDLTATLNAAQIQTLEAKLAGFEGKKGSQIGVLIVATTKPETIEQYSIRVVEKWKLGRKGVDDGVLLLIAKNDRKLRIEVGRGLEGGLNDATAKRIIAEIITPAFKQGDFAGGINTGVDSIIKVVNGEVLPTTPPPQTEAASSSDKPSDPRLLAGLGVILSFLIGSSIYLILKMSQSSFAGNDRNVSLGQVSQNKKNHRTGGRWSPKIDRPKKKLAAESSSGGWGWGSDGYSGSSSSSSSSSYSGGGGGFSGGGSSGSW